MLPAAPDWQMVMCSCNKRGMSGSLMLMYRLLLLWGKQAGGCMLPMHYQLDSR